MVWCSILPMFPIFIFIHVSFLLFFLHFLCFIDRPLMRYLNIEDSTPFYERQTSWVGYAFLKKEKSGRMVAHLEQNQQKKSERPRKVGPKTTNKQHWRTDGESPLSLTFTITFPLLLISTLGSVLFSPSPPEQNNVTIFGFTFHLHVIMISISETHLCVCINIITFESISYGMKIVNLSIIIFC